MFKLKSLIFIPAIFLLITSCGQVASTKLTAPAGSTGGGAAPAPGAGTGNGTVVNSAGFFAAITTDSLEDTAVLHIADAAYGANVGTTNMATECQIDYGTTGAAADIFCILEIEELDLLFTAVDIQVHVPSDMCSYLRVKPYSFYQFEAHDGPTAASYSINDGTIVDGANTTNGVPTCQYNHTLEGYGNCCTGEYDLTVTTRDASGVVTAINTTNDIAWDGHSGKCLSGPATATQTRNANGVPQDSIFYVDSIGYNRLYTIPAGIGTVYGNVWAANFYNPADHASGKPPPMERPTALEIADSSERVLPNDTYAWECLDTAEDLLARIRIMVREWNTNVLAEGGNADVTGADPLDPSQALNDREDWLDWGDLYPGASM